MNESVVELLASRLRQPLPGPMVGSRFEAAPHHGRPHDQIPPDARRAAVLVLLYPYRGRWHLPLTVRNTDLPDHAGQVSLPGGAIEPGETSDRAALREFHEELGAKDEKIDLLGRLSPLYVEVSNFAVQPWVGVAEKRPLLVPNPAEVEQVLEIPLSHLVDPANLDSEIRYRQGKPYTAPHFVWGPHRIWGATYMILGELVTLLEELGPQSE